MKIERCLVKIDEACNFIPFVSTVTNVIDLLAKWILEKGLKFGKANHPYTAHLSGKPLFVCTLLLIPIAGNLVYLMARKKRRQAETVKCQKELATFYMDCIEKVKMQQPHFEEALKKNDPDALLPYSLFLQSLVVKSFIFTLIWPQKGFSFDYIRKSTTIQPLHSLYQNVMQQSLKTLESQNNQNASTHNLTESVRHLIQL